MPRGVEGPGPGLGLGRAALLLLFVLVSYAPAFHGDFVWDDRMLIVEDGRVRDASRFTDLLSSSFWETGDRHDRFRSFFRPLVAVTYFVDHALWGLRPLGFHVTNVLLHLLCCLLVRALARDAGLGPWPAFTAAALFAAHPTHVESVAWISGRTDLLSVMLLLAAFLASLRAARARRPLGPTLVAGLMFALALFSKEVAATFPLLVALDRFAATGRLRRAVEAALPYVGVLAGYVVVRLALIGGMGPALYQLDPLAWTATACFALARYVMLLIFPFGLDAHYPYQPLASLLSPVAIISAAMLAVLAWALVLLWRQAPRTAFWLAWIPLTLAPVLTFGRFGDVILADRFLYAPSVGLSLLVAAALARLAREVSPHTARLGLGLALVCCVLLSGASFLRSRVWRSDLALFSSMVRTSPDSGLVHCNLGLALYRTGDNARAVEHYERAIALEPTYSMAYNNLAVSLEALGRRGGALAAYETALGLAPGHLEAGVNLGHLLTTVGQVERGIALLRKVVANHPRYPPALYALAEVLARTGGTEEAMAYLARVRAIDPADPNAYYLEGKVLQGRGETALAAMRMREFLRLWPGANDAWTRAAYEVIRRAEAGGVPLPAVEPAR